jgi:preprotein translocase subunit SecG
MDIQTIIVIALIVVAFVYMLRILLTSAKGGACSSGKCGCAKTANTKRE